MGKGGKGKKKATPGSGGDDDDALLNAAISENKLLKAKQDEEREQWVKERVAAAKAAQQQQKKAGSVLTLAQSLEKADRVMLFTITRVTPDGSRDMAVSPSGAVTFYVDAADAQADLKALQTAEPDAKLALDHTPLGRAFALTQGLMGLSAPGPTALQFPRSVVNAEGERGVPAELQQGMRRAGPFPLFYSDKIGSEIFTPVFFDRADLAEFWTSGGGAPDDTPEPTVTDLRIIISRTMQEAGDWAPLVYVPHKASAEAAKEVMSRATRDAEISQGFQAGTVRMKMVAHTVAVRDGDEPPALL